MTRYQEIRAASKSMRKKVNSTTEITLMDWERAARRMTIRVLGRTIVMDDETAENAFLDFLFSEYRLHGKTMMEMADPAAAQLTPPGS
jgi:hypothetical protein